MYKLFKNKKRSGQALVLLLVFMTVVITMASAAVGIIITNSLVASKYEQTEMALSLAEGGIENALIRLLRDPSYTGDTLTIVGIGSSVVTVVGTGTKTIDAVGTVGNFKRSVRVVVEDSSGALTVNSWEEVF